MRNLSGIVSIVFLCLIYGSKSSWAVLVKLSDLQTMAEKSDVVFHGYVGEQQVTRDRMGRIITLTKLAVIDGLYGAQPGEIITFYQVGGELDGVVMPLIGGHVYRLGQEAILFGLTLKDTFVSFGAGQGKLDINPNDSEEPVREDLGDVSAVLPSASGGFSVYTPTPLTYSSPDLLKDEIRLMLKNRK